MPLSGQNFGSRIEKTLLEENGQHLQQHQVSGVDFIMKAYHNGHGCILADEMGLGKTCEAIMCLMALRHIAGESRPHLIICPLSVWENWNVEFQRFAWKTKWIMYGGEKEARLKLQNSIKDQPGTWDVLITTYEQCLNDAEFLVRFSWKCVVVDEAHRLKNSESRMYEALSQFHIKFVLLMTGTPVQNNLEELYSLLSICNAAEFSLKKRRQFLDTHRGPQGLLALRKLLESYLIRRTKLDVGLDLPEKAVVMLYHGITPLQKKIYKSVLLRNYEIIQNGSRKSFMNTYIQLRKCVDHPYLFEGVEPEPFTEGEHVVEASGKLMLLDSLLEHLHKHDHKVLIFSQMTRMLDILQDYLTFRGYLYERLDGSVRSEERFAAVNRFSKTEQTFCFLLSTRAGGVGLNLVAADTVVFVDSDINPQQDIQAAARVHRIGQTRPVRIIRLVGRNTVEEVILSRAARKLELAQKVMDEEADEKEAKVRWTEMLMFGLRELSKDDQDGTLTSEKPNFEKILGQTKGGLWQPIVEERQNLDENQELLDDYYTFEGQDYTMEAKNADKAVLESIFVEAAVKSAEPVSSTSGHAEALTAARRQRTTVRKLTADELAENQRILAAERKQQQVARKEKLWTKNGYVSTNLPEADGSDEQMFSGDEEDDIYYVSGDVTHPKPRAAHLSRDLFVVHCVDSSGEWGRGGVFSALSARSTKIEEAYALAKKMQDLKLGDAHLIPVEDQSNIQSSASDVAVYVVLVVAQTRTKGQVSHVQLDAFKNGLQRIAKYATTHSCSVHLPRIGFGTPNFNWYGIERVIRKVLAARDIPTYVYYFSRKQQLSRRNIGNDEGRNDSPPVEKKIRIADESPRRLSEDKPCLSGAASNDGAYATIFEGCNVALHGLTEEETQKLRRLIAAYDGDVAESIHTPNLTHVVTSELSSEAMSATAAAGVVVVRPDWVLACVKAQKLLPCKEFAVDV